jgi:hypothetical protein
LVEAAAGGDHKAWDALIDRFAPMVWLIAGGHQLDTARAVGVFEMTWLRLLQHLEEVDEPGRIGVWLAITARREALRVRPVQKPPSLRTEPTSVFEHTSGGEVLDFRRRPR